MKDDIMIGKYRKFQEKYELPQLKELKAKFRFDSENFENIDQLRNEISEQLFSFSERVIEHAITGGESFCCMFEQDMITSKERTSLFELYKKLQVLKWENNLLTIKPNEKRTAEWISKTWALWNNELEAEMTSLCTKMSQSWSGLKFKSEKAEYLG